MNNDTSKATFFKSNYRFIDFKKASEQSATTSSASTETAESFYLSLINEGAKPKNKNSPVDTSTELSKFEEKVRHLPRAASQVRKFNAKDLFKAAQNNDLDYVKDHAENSCDDLVALDDFQWNLLMIAIAAQSNRVVSFLVNDLNNREIIEKLLQNKDKSGNDSLKLAERFKNATAVDLIESYNRKKLIKTEPIEEIDELEEEGNVLYCDFCKKEFNTKNETYKEHLASIVHQLSKTERSGELGKKKFTDYNLRSSNKGYELMLKLGWNETSGLGSNEQGRVNPVRAKMKLDRHGIGVVKEKSDKSSSNIPPVMNSKTKIFKLKKSKSSSDGASLKEYKKDTSKMKTLERNLRFYFNN